jgi:hypothetical protein
MGAPFLTGLEHQAAGAEKVLTEMLREELENLIEDAQPSQWFESPRNPFPATLQCGCEVRLRKECDGESVWTEREWRMCDSHEGLKP